MGFADSVRRRKKISVGMIKGLGIVRFFFRCTRLEVSRDQLHRVRKMLKSHGPDGLQPNTDCVTFSGQRVA